MSDEDKDAKDVYDVVPSVVFEKDDGTTETLGLGGRVGRGIDADLQLADPRISVAHSGIALRRGGIWLLAYRGRHWIDGIEHGDIELQRGQRVQLAPGVSIRVKEVRLPALVPTITVDDKPAYLVEPRAWHIDATGMLRPGEEPGRPRLWEANGDWYAQAANQSSVLLFAGDPVQIGEHMVCLELETVEEASTSGTVLDEPPELAIHSYENETEFHAPGRPVVHLRRTNHLVLREIGRQTAHTGRPVEWIEVAQRVWPVNQHHDKLWYKQLSRLKPALIARGVPPSLVRTQGGLVQLVLREHDSFHLHDAEMDA